MNLQWNMILNEKRIPETKSTNHLSFLRSEVDSDYNRIVTSASFRRLQDKTQVFPLDNSDFVRTRLTHSLEVASIAKFIGKQVYTSIMEKYPDTDLDEHKMIETLNCAALLHDIGNPPFGHFGEFSIRQWFKNNLSKITYQDRALSEYLDEQQLEDFYAYEGNAQALRIVSKLHHLSGKYGMRLTSGVLDTIIKYPVNSLEWKEETKKLKSERRLTYKKIGYYQSEEALFYQIKNNTGTLGCRNPLTFILEAADDIAYTFADLEDGYKKGMYSYDDLLEVVEKSEDEKGVEKLKNLLESASSEEHHDDVSFDVQKEAVFQWLTRKQLYCVTSIKNAFMDHYLEIMNGEFEEELIACCSESKIIKALKDFAFKKVYCDKSILRLEILGNEILTFFLDQFVRAVVHYDSSYEVLNPIEEKYIALLSSNYLEQYHDSVKDKKDEEKIYYKLLLAADYVAGMTDGFARRLYQEIRGMK